MQRKLKTVGPGITAATTPLPPPDITVSWSRVVQIEEIQLQSATEEPPGLYDVLETH